MSQEFESQLSEGSQRFLAHVVVHGLAHGRRAPADFLRHFPPHAIMEALGEHPELRAKIVAPATGLKPKIAAKKAPADCAADLVIALEEHETDAKTLVSLLDPDDRVRYLPAEELWSYVVEGEFWEAEDEATREIARAHIQHMLERALSDGIIRAVDVVDGAGVPQLAQHLPPAELARILAAALDAGRGGAPFTDEQLLSECAPAVLVRHVPLPVIWSGVVEGPIAKALGVANRPTPAIVPPPAEEASVEAEPTAHVSETVAKPKLPPPGAAIGRVPLVKKPVKRAAAAKEENAAPRRSRRPKKKNSKAPGRRSKRPAAAAS